MPVPAIAQAISAPNTPVWAPNRAGSENTPAPTIEPTTIIDRVPSETFAVRSGAPVVSVAVIGAVLPPPRRRYGAGRAGTARTAAGPTDVDCPLWSLRYPVGAAPRIRPYRRVRLIPAHPVWVLHRYRWGDSRSFPRKVPYRTARPAGPAFAAARPPVPFRRIAAHTGDCGRYWEHVGAAPRAHDEVCAGKTGGVAMAATAPNEGYRLRRHVRPSVALTGLLLIVLGMMNGLDGIAAITHARVFSKSAVLVFGPLPAWGWAVLAIAVVQAGCGVLLLFRISSVRWLAALTIVLDIFTQMVVMVTYPFWALTIIGVNIVALYVLFAHAGAAPDEVLARGDIRPSMPRDTGNLPYPR